MPVSDQTKRVVARLKEGRVISIVSNPIRRLADARSLIMLSQMVYWTTRDKNVQESGGWFSKPTRDWIAETGLTRSYVASCLNTLREKRIVKVWQRATKTAPWFKLDLGQLYVLCQGQPATSEVALSQFIADAAFREAIVGRPLPYYTVLADAVGDALLGLFLSRCVYWQEALEQRNRLSTQKSTWGWSSNDWTNDIGISRTQLRILLKQASDQRLVEVTETDRPFPGIWVKFDEVAKAIRMPVHVCPVHTVESPTVDSGPPQPWPADRNTQRSTNVPSTVWHGHSYTDDSRNPSAITTSGMAGNDQECPQSDQGTRDSAHSDNGNEQSTRARGVDYEDYTTTTTACARDDTVVVVDSADAESPNPEALIFPPSISERELPGIKRTIEGALPHRRQALLDELSQRKPDKPISYLRWLVTADNQANGGLVLEVAHIAQARRDREAELERLRNGQGAAPTTSAPQPPTVDPMTPIDPEERQRRVERAKAALKGRLAEENPA